MLKATSLQSQGARVEVFFFFFFPDALGLCCCVRALSSCGKRGPLLAAVRGPLIAVPSPVAEHGLQAHGLQQLWPAGSRAQAQQLWCTGPAAPHTWDPPGPGPEPVSPALAGGFPTIAPPGKPPELKSCSLRSSITPTCLFQLSKKGKGGESQ